MKNMTSLKKFQENSHLMDPEILYFGHFKAEKIEFEVGRSNLKNLF